MDAELNASGVSPIDRTVSLYGVTNDLLLAVAAESSTPSIPCPATEKDIKINNARRFHLFESQLYAVSGAEERVRIHASTALSSAGAGGDEQAEVGGSVEAIRQVRRWMDEEVADYTSNVWPQTLFRSAGETWYPDATRAF